MDTEATMQLVASFEAQLADRDDKLDRQALLIEALTDSLAKYQFRCKAAEALLMQSRVVDMEAE